MLRHPVWAFVVAFAAIATAGLILLTSIRNTSQQQIPVVCQQYDIFNLSNGQLVPNPSMPLWLRHQAALRDHCPVDPSWGSLPTDHEAIN